MVSRIEVIKDLRAKGASVKMIDDVAQYLETHSCLGYESPVFTATVEFIIKVKNMLKGMEQQQEQEVDIAGMLSQVQEDEIKDISFGAASVAISNDEEINDDQRKKILNHLHQLENLK